MVIKVEDRCLWTHDNQYDVSSRIYTASYFMRVKYLLDCEGRYPKIDFVERDRLYVQIIGAGVLQFFSRGQRAPLCASSHTLDTTLKKVVVLVSTRSSQSSDC